MVLRYMDRDGSKKNKKSDFVSKSIILTALTAFVNYIYSAAMQSLTGFVLSGRSNVAKESSLIRKLTQKIQFRSRFSVPIKRFFNKAFGESQIINAVSGYFKSLPAAGIRVFGILGVSFGLYTAGVFVILSLLPNAPETNALNLYIGLSCAIISLPLALSKKTISASIKESRFLSFIFFRALGIKPEYLLTQKSRRGNSAAAFIIGTVLGLSTISLSPIIPLSLPFAVFLAAVMLAQPEIGLVLIALLVPFLPTIPVAMLLIFTAICYFFKLIQGKRVFRLKPVDISVAAFLLLELLGGIISVNPAASIKPALLYACLMSAYFLSVNLLTSSSWIKRCVYAMFFSAGIVAAIGIFENYFGKAQITWIDSEMFNDIENRVVSTFGNPNVLAEYLIMLLPVIFSIFVCAKSGVKKFASLFLLIICGACLLFTWSRGAWLGILFGMLIFMLLYSRATLKILSFFVLFVPFLPFVLPSTIVERFTSIGNLRDSSTSYRVNIWKGVVSMLRDNVFGGIGVGEGAFSDVYMKYSLAGIESAPHSHNLFLQIIVELGIAALLVFIFAMIMCTREVLVFYRYSEDIPRKTKLLSCSFICGIAAVMLQGMTDYIWYNYRVFCIFWLLIGIGTAVARINERSKEPPDPSAPYTEISVYQQQNR